MLETELARLYVEIGVLGLIAVVFIGISIRNQNSLSNKYDRMFDLLLKSKGVHNEEEDEKMKVVENGIDNLLDKLIECIQADRVFLVRYHNGGKDLSGNSFLKMSITNEKTEIGVKGIIRDFKDQFRSSFSWLINSLETNEMVKIKDTSTLQEIDTNLYQFFQIRKVKMFYGIVVRSEKNIAIGYIGIEYLSYKKINNEQLDHCLKDNKLKIEALLLYMK